ncbi:hypothetical protein ciss_07020 [Carboxydothermus islandicus]|uniref:DZANK-type domain-containing protein n=1 Tax=Carboxydothermus islandicus TaxID=661089 RepID=A0A1L8D0V6_9THEO|nr:hypothetical protein ciss_07020 [Carboxydothermus islandicus]
MKAIKSKEKSKEPSILCPACQHENKSHYNFCIKCGKQLKENPVILDYKSLA